ncbi:MAG: hypothetical protein ACRD0C_05385 [Acidimicrobiia bacterium]
MTRDARRLRPATLGLAIILFAAGCGGDDKGASDKPGQPVGEAAAETGDPGPATAAARTRSTLNGLLQEHVILTAATTGAILGGRSEEFTAAGAALEANSNALTGALAGVFGDEVGKTFDPLWKQHITMVVNYTQGLAAKDKAKTEQALTELTAYAGDFGAFINSVLPDLTQEAVADRIKEHVTTLKAVIDDFARNDPVTAYTDLRTAAGHMGLIAASLTGAIAAKFPDKVAGNPQGAGATLVTTLNMGLREHVFLASGATGAALGGRAEEFTAAASALKSNSNSLTEAISNIYGPEAGKAFGPLWERHITFFVEYTTGLAARDKAKQDAAITSLVQYSADFGAFLSTASPALTKETVTELVKTHILTLKDVIDAQSKKKLDEAYNKLRTAAAHMEALANPLAVALVQQFPDKFKA